MKLSIDAGRLINRPLTFRPFLGHDHIAEVNGLRVGWILLTAETSGKHEWWWSMTGPCCSMARVRNAGRCSSLEDAKRQLRDMYEDWLTWAIKQSGPVTWFGTSAAAESASPPALT
jgi:hypothetical protein